MEPSEALDAMSPSRVLFAIRELVIAAEEQGWDSDPALVAVLNDGRAAYEALRVVMADADDHEGDA